MASRRAGASYPALRRKLLGWPGVEEASHHGKPSLKAFGKFLVRLHEDGDSIVVAGVTFDEREMLTETQPHVFYIAPHYRNFPSILVRLSASDPAHVESMVCQRWRQPRQRIRADFDATTCLTPKPRRNVT